MRLDVPPYRSRRIRQERCSSVFSWTNTKPAARAGLAGRLNCNINKEYRMYGMFARLYWKKHLWNCILNCMSNRAMNSCYSTCNILTALCKCHLPASDERDKSYLRYHIHLQSFRHHLPWCNHIFSPPLLPSISLYRNQDMLKRRPIVVRFLFKSQYRPHCK
jgi:hypothetical protein